MEDEQQYRERVKLAVEHMHNCSAVWLQTVPVHEVFMGKTAWKGEVEVYDLTGHPKAKRAYAWSHRDGPKDQDERFVAVLEIPPVKDAKTAVQASIMADSKKR